MSVTFLHIRIKSSPLLRGALCAIGAIVLAASSVMAQDIPDTCDADYYDVLGARSYIEATREVEAAQRLILKADSVLEYSCFYKDIEHMYDFAGSFSEGGFSTAIIPPEFNGGINVDPGSLDTSLNLVVYNALIEILDSFDHVYAGGTFSTIPPSSGCNPMNVVWHVSKCESFDSTTWVTLEDLQNTDIRAFPEPCATLAPSRSTDIAAAYLAAYPPANTPPTSGGMQSEESFLDYISGGACSTSAAIPTGIITSISDPDDPSLAATDVPEVICIKPKCVNNGTGVCN